MSSDTKGAAIATAALSDTAAASLGPGSHSPHDEPLSIVVQPRLVKESSGQSHKSQKNKPPSPSSALKLSPASPVRALPSALDSSGAARTPSSRRRVVRTVVQKGSLRRLPTVSVSEYSQMEDDDGKAKLPKDTKETIASTSSSSSSSENSTDYTCGLSMFCELDSLLYRVDWFYHASALITIFLLLLLAGLFFFIPGASGVLLLNSSLYRWFFFAALMCAVVYVTMQIQRILVSLVETHLSDKEVWIVYFAAKSITTSVSSLLTAVAFLVSRPKLLVDFDSNTAQSVDTAGVAVLLVVLLHMLKKYIVQRVIMRFNISTYRQRLEDIKFREESIRSMIAGEGREIILEDAPKTGASTPQEKSVVAVIVPATSPPQSPRATSPRVTKLKTPNVAGLTSPVTGLRRLFKPSAAVPPSDGTPPAAATPSVLRKPRHGRKETTSTKAMERLMRYFSNYDPEHTISAAAKSDEERKMAEAQAFDSERQRGNSNASKLRSLREIEESRESAMSPVADAPVGTTTAADVDPDQQPTDAMPPPTLATLFQPLTSPSNSNPSLPPQELSHSRANSRSTGDGRERKVAIPPPDATDAVAIASPTSSSSEPPVSDAAAIKGALPTSLSRPSSLESKKEKEEEEEILLDDGNQTGKKKKHKKKKSRKPRLEGEPNLPAAESQLNELDRKCRRNQKIIFSNLDLEKKGYLVLADFYSIFDEETAQKAFKIFFVQNSNNNKTKPKDGEEAEEKVTRKNVREALKTYYNDRDTLAHSLNNFQNLTVVVRDVFHVAFWIVAVMVIMLVYNNNVQAMLLTFGTVIVSISFAFSSSIKNVVESIVFLLIVKPYDVGDRVQIGIFNGGGPLKQWVHAISLMTTTFRNSYGKISIMANSELARKAITNLTKSKNAIFELQFTVSFHTEADKIDQLAKKVQGLLKKSTLHSWQPSFEMYATTLKDCNYMTLAFWLTHEKDFSQSGVLYKDVTCFLEHLRHFAQELAIEVLPPALPVQFVEEGAAMHGPTSNIVRAITK